MKKTYIAPTISVYNIGKMNIMAASLDVGEDFSGNLGSIRSKRNAVFEDYDEDEL